MIRKKGAGEVHMTVRQLYRKVRDQLKNGGLESYAAEARFLFEGVLGIDYQNILLCGEMEASPRQVEQTLQAVEKRLTGYPLQYITGMWEFYSYPFEVGEGVLIPRPDTEALCDVALKHLNHCGAERPVIADLCSGSGCLAVAISLKFEAAKVYAVEKYEAALKYLRRNIALNKADVRVIEGDVLEGGFLEPAEPLDLIVCNPPYLTGEDMQNLQAEVSYEPETALYGDEDGLLFYRSVSEQWFARLKPDGMLAFEVGIGQEEDVIEILNRCGYQNICTYQDVCGIIRVLTAQRPPR